MLCPETYPIILAHEPAVSSAIDDTSNAISLENCKGCLILITEYTAGGDTDIVLTVHEGATAAVAEAGTYPIATAFPIWVNTNAAAVTWTRQADAVTYSIDATLTTNQMVAFYIPAGILTNGRPYIQLGTAGANASNLASAIYILDGARYQGNTVYDVIT